MKSVVRCLWGGVVLLVLASCSLVQLFRLKPLSATEKNLVGTWVCSDYMFEQAYTFRADRTCEYQDLSQAPGETVDYVWEADSAKVTFYAPNAAFLEPDLVNGYTMTSSSTMTLEDATYVRQ